jgi:hypothetical protein
MSNSEELLIRDVREEFAKSKSYYKVCRTLDLPMQKVKAILEQEEYNAPRREPVYGGQGRPELRKYIVATKDAYENWDLNDPDIILMRADYELGTHEMCQGRDGDVIIQYSIPRANKQPRPGYFNPGYLNEATA